MQAVRLRERLSYRSECGNPVNGSGDLIYKTGYGLRAGTDSARSAFLYCLRDQNTRAGLLQTCLTTVANATLRILIP